MLIGQQQELSGPVPSALPLALAVRHVDARENAAVDAERMAVVNDEIIEIWLEAGRCPAFFDCPLPGLQSNRKAADALSPCGGDAVDENVAVCGDGRLHDRAT